MAKKHPADPVFTIEWLQVEVGNTYIHHGYSAKFDVRLRIMNDGLIGTEKATAVYLEENATQGDIAERLERRSLPIWCNIVGMVFPAGDLVAHDKAVNELKRYAEMMYGDEAVLPGYKKKA